MHIKTYYSNATTFLFGFLKYVGSDTMRRII